jgi:hypothetical protein
MLSLTNTRNVTRDTDEAADCGEVEVAGVIAVRAKSLGSQCLRRKNDQVNDHIADLGRQHCNRNDRNCSRRLFWQL